MFVALTTRPREERLGQSWSKRVNPVRVTFEVSWVVFAPAYREASSGKACPRVLTELSSSENGKLLRFKHLSKLSLSRGWIVRGPMQCFGESKRGSSSLPLAAQQVAVQAWEQFVLFGIPVPFGASQDSEPVQQPLFFEALLGGSCCKGLGWTRY